MRQFLQGPSRVFVPPSCIYNIFKKPEGFLQLVFLLHEPSGCVLLVFCQKQHGQDFVLASFLEHRK